MFFFFYGFVETIQDGGISGGDHFLWPRNESRRRHEYQRSHFLVSYKYDLPECVFRC